eukprot:1153816-Pelagomonas_calceolata.AAC.4
MRPFSSQCLEVYTHTHSQDGDAISKPARRKRGAAAMEPPPPPAHPTHKLRQRGRIVTRRCSTVLACGPCFDEDCDPQAQCWPVVLVSMISIPVPASRNQPQAAAAWQDPDLQVRC